MSDLEPEDNLGNGWLAIAVGIGCLVFAWYLYAKVGVNTELIGKAAIANSGLGKKLLIGLMAFVGTCFLVRGIAKIRSNK